MATISFSCACGATVSVGEHLAGKKGYCPQCKKPIEVPKASTPAGAKPAPPSPALRGAVDADPDTFKVASQDLTASKDVAIDEDERPAPGPRGTKSASMRFKCPNCSQTLLVPLHLAGQKGKCGKCSATFTAPVPEILKQARAKMAAKNAPPKSSLRDAFSILKVKCSCGLTSAVPRANAERGEARCPACNAYLDVGPKMTIPEGDGD